MLPLFFAPHGDQRAMNLTRDAIGDVAEEQAGRALVVVRAHYDEIERRGDARNDSDRLAGFEHADQLDPVALMGRISSLSRADASS